jgi:hypothetical protein
MSAVLHYNPRRDLITPKAGGTERDLSTRHGAHQHAAELNEWWHKRGYPQVHHQAVQRTNQHGHGTNEPTWMITSNLINGLPPKVEK